MDTTSSQVGNSDGSISIQAAGFELPSTNQVGNVYIGGSKEEIERLSKGATHRTFIGSGNCLFYFGDGKYLSGDELRSRIIQLETQLSSVLDRMAHLEAKSVSN
jgi:hypothetical protein